MKDHKPSHNEIVQELWKRGNLKFKLDKDQNDLISNYNKTEEKIITWLLSRRRGKSHALCCLALATCLANPNVIVKYVAPTKLQARTIIRPLLAKLLEDCPIELKPKEKKNEYIYSFYNGSEIQIAGSDGGHAEKLRGTDSHLVIIDEAGSCKDLHNLIKSILMPTTLITKGKIILASTPPKENDHEFLEYIEDCEARGTLTVKSIENHPRLTKEEISKELESYGGRESEYVRREYFCEIIRSADLSVLPEFNADLQKEVVRDVPRPAFFDRYVGMDVGGKDLTAVLFGYYDYKNDLIVIEDEISMDFQKSGNNLEKLTQEIDKKERSLGENFITHEVKRPYLRLSDIDHIVINEINKYSSGTLNFIAAKRETKDVTISDLRFKLLNNKIAISPKCKMLISHLKNARWYSQTNKTKFARSKVDGMGHYDFVDALIILVRNVQSSRNPYPAGYQYDKKDLFINNYTSYNKGKTSAVDIFKKIYKVKGK